MVIGAVGMIGVVMLVGALSLAQTPAKHSPKGEYTVSSPDRKIAIRVTVQDRLQYAVSFQGRPVVLDSPFGLEFRDAPPLGKGLVVRETQRQSVHSAWENPWGKRRHVQDRYNALRLSLQEGHAPGRRIDFLVRAYDDGVAFRYVLPQQEGLKDFVLTKEETQFVFAGDPTVWAANYGGYASAQEAQFHRQRMSFLMPDAPYGVPLLVQADKAAYVAITEADLQDWAGLYLSGTADRAGTLLYESGLIRGGDPAQRVRVPLTGKRLLRLVVGDGGDGFEFDHADWAEATLIAKDGSRVPLSALHPIAAVQGYGHLGMNTTVDGHTIRIGAKTYAHGLGTHSKGELLYNLDGKYAAFESDIGIDAEVGHKGSVTFAVYALGSKTRATTGLVTRLSPRTDGQGLVKTTAPRSSPWRVLLIGESPGALVESDLILNLSEPCKLADTSWIRPGKCAWDHWWSGDVKMDTATMKEYVQFAADMGWPYQLVDWNWYGDFGQDRSDITHVNPNLDLPELRRFAQERNVRLFVWLYWGDVDKKLRAGLLDDVFALYAQWGLAGVKIDFMNRDDQEMVNWYHTIVEKAAAHRLMVDFHGAYKPTGTQRTYPNQITREGVLGEEYAKFSDLLTPEHDVTIPFTRMLAGPMDYTPGGFLNRSRAQWKRTLPTQVMGTRCHELAKFVVFDSPLTVVCDHPDHYRGQPGLEFLRVVPTVWDDTQIVDGKVGEYILSARRSGKEWFLGGMTNGEARTVKVPLCFLGKGQYTAHLFADAPDSADNAEHLTESKRTVRKNDVLTVRMAPGGGVAIHFTSVK